MCRCVAECFNISSLPCENHVSQEDCFRKWCAAFLLNCSGIFISKTTTTTSLNEIQTTASDNSANYCLGMKNFCWWKRNKEKMRWIQTIRKTHMCKNSLFIWRSLKCSAHFSNASTHLSTLLKGTILIVVDTSVVLLNLTRLHETSTILWCQTN